MDLGSQLACFCLHAAPPQPSPCPQSLDKIAILREVIGAIPQQIEDVVKRKIRAFENRLMAHIEALVGNRQPTSHQQEYLQNIGNDNFPDPEVVESKISATSSDVVATKHVPAYEVQMVEAIATSPVAPEVDAVKDVTVKEIVQSGEDVHANEVQKVKTVATSEVALMVDAVKQEAAKEIVQNEVVAASAKDMCGKEVASTDAVVAASVMPRTEVQSE